ncbi:hypothetical protein KC669_02350, partial [Candidatus Dojkabacteria bacterium]|nr:hypothetical protein [Candidatus Dojkabacteria bacterium]
MKLSKIGKITFDVWNDIPNHNGNIELIEFVVMPNHVHGLIFMDYENDDNIDAIEGDGDRRPLRNKYPSNYKYDRINEKIPKIIRSYKSTVTRIINKEFPNSGFKWQRSYYDQIIKS